MTAPYTIGDMVAVGATGWVARPVLAPPSRPIRTRINTIPDDVLVPGGGVTA